MIPAAGGKAVITSTVECERETIGRILEQVQQKPHEMDVRPIQVKRSLKANAYYHILLAKLAQKLRVSETFLHNMMLRRYGQPFIVGGSLMRIPIPDTDEAARKIDESDEVHAKPTSNVREGADGVNYRVYILMRGSSSYSSQEFAALLNGLIDECKEQGIVTMTPLEVAQMGADMESAERRSA